MKRKPRAWRTTSTRMVNSNQHAALETLPTDEPHEFQIMKNAFYISIPNFAFALSVLCLIFSGTATAQIFKTDVTPLIDTACLHCHDSSSETGLNFEDLDYDLTDPNNFRKWTAVFDRAENGEMPPASEDRPDPDKLKFALTALKKELLSASVAKQSKAGRVSARRLTKTELRYTLQDLLLINSDVTSGVPDEVESGSFDTVGINQRISAVHMESYLQAADEALNVAINLGRNPYRSVETTDFAHMQMWHDKPANLGGGITRKLKFGKGFVLFRDVDYVTTFRFRISTPGIHRISARVAAYQSKTPLTAKFIIKDQSGGARLVKAIDLQPGEPVEVVFDTFLKPGDRPYLTFDMEGVEPFTAINRDGGPKKYRGRGLAIMSQKIEGPLSDSWPNQSTSQFFKSELLNPNGSPNGPFKVAKTDKSPTERVQEIIARFAPRAFRRPVNKTEIQSFVDLAKPAIDEGRGFDDVIRVPLRSMLSSPQFLLFDEEAGTLDEFAIANRLSYFLWKSLPDRELFEIAASGNLTKPDVLKQQVDRMLADKKSSRFVQDFLGQWLRLNKLNAPSPDDGLYPEYDELLASAIPQETHLFFGELIKENLGLENLIDSKFTFLNRRLAKLYEIPGVDGQDFQKVDLPDDSPRGGVLTQAAILKTTANGTTTSPVMRGNFVLTNFLGTPPSPPPADIGSIEPDTRGKTTIREILDAHRDMASCAQCHREIDPPGFALESFDPIGGFRKHYRASGGESNFGGFNVKLPPKQGPPVDPSGVTSDGQTFSGIQDFKELLLDHKEQIANNFIAQLIMYSTGGEIEFADREEIKSILNRTAENGFPVRDIIHEVVQSKIFNRK